MSTRPAIRSRQRAVGGVVELDLADALDLLQLRHQREAGDGRAAPLHVLEGQLFSFFCASSVPK